MLLLSLSYALAGPPTGSTAGPLPGSKASAKSTAPSVHGPELASEAGQAVPVRIVAGMRGGIWVDGCAPVEMERREGDTWMPLPSVVCAAPTPAHLVETELTVAVSPPSAGEYRAVIAWGAGCAQGVPFVLAGYKTLGAARSAAFLVSAPPAPVDGAASPVPADEAAPSTPANR